MNNTPGVSVVVPVYNQEKYIVKCLESILNQTYKNFEIIIVNDGSTDQSMSLISKFATDFSNNIKVIDKENGGVASARNAGVKEAQGKYVIHVDPDDWVEPNYLYELYNKAEEESAIMVVCDYYEEYSDKTIVVKHSDLIANDSTEALKFGIVTGKIWGTCWNKLIRRDAINQRLCFEPGIDFQEDKLFIVRVLTQMGGGKISYMPYPLYHYNRTNSVSAVNNISEKSILDITKVYRIILDEEKDKQKKIKYLDGGGRMEFYIWQILNSTKLDNKTILSYIRPFRKYIKYWDSSLTTKLRFWIYTTFGKNKLFGIRKSQTQHTKR